MADVKKITWVDELEKRPWKVAPDLLFERELSTFFPRQLINILDGSEQRTEDRRRIEMLVYNDPDFQHTNILYMTREERYENALKKAILIVQKNEEYGFEDEWEKYIFRSTVMGMEQSPFGLHHIMFLPTLSAQASDEQKQTWLHMAEQYMIIGTYAQTEIGHGTNLRRLETTATFDKNTDEFILHTPTLTGTKFWPGGLGHTSNYAIVLAQLHSNNKCYGIHPFIVQLRSSVDHSPMPGITIGDIGPKNGYESIDNGFLKFSQVRIPRMNMLMKNSEILKSGEYRKAPSSDRLTYSTMVFVRSMLVHDLAKHLAKAVTIAIRYSAIRRQGEGVDNEMKILDYKTQQFKLFPLLASAYVYWRIGDHLRMIYFNSISKILSGDVSLLPELHMVSAGLKAITTSECSAGIEVCRQACGGHGFSQASGFSLLYASAAPSCTYEGENTVMFLQTARYLIKCFKNKDEEDLPDSVKYLQRSMAKQLPNTLNNNWSLSRILEVYSIWAYLSVSRAYEHINEGIKKGFTYQKSWNEAGQSLILAARIHCLHYTLSSYYRMLEDMPASELPDIISVLTELGELFGVWHLLEGGGRLDFLEPPVLESLHAALSIQIEKLRKNAVALVDAFDFHDLSLHSCLGCYDGKAYERLYDFADKNPMNKQKVHTAYDTILKPFLKARGGKI